MASPRSRQLLRFDPVTVMAQLDQNFDDLVRRTWGSPTPERSRLRTGFVPPVDISREDTDVVLRLEVPGLDPENDLAIEVERGRLIISGERQESRDDSTDSVLVRELRYGAFRREFALPEGVASDQVEADYDAGVLSVRLRGVAAPAPEPERVKVNVGSGRTRAEIEQGPEGDSEATGDRATSEDGTASR